MPDDGVVSIPHEEVLTYAEILRIVGAMANMGVSRIKITGGEPLVRKGVTDLIATIKALPGIEQVTLTTNGVLLGKMLPDLLAAGLSGVNISLDSMNRETHRKLTRAGDLEAIMASIHKASAAPIPVKVNAVPIWGYNSDELTDLAELARHTVDTVRFIELMPVGVGKQLRGIATGEIIAKLEASFGDLQPFCGNLGNGPAEYYSVEGFRGKIGFISAVSHGFCNDCNRVRLTSEGALKLCLGQNLKEDLKTVLRSGATDEELAEIIADALRRKPKGHRFHSDADSGRSNMNTIGG
jgi:cyclic pyranopterin phosphate synthase